MKGSIIAAGLATSYAATVLAQSSCPITLQPKYPQPIVGDGHSARLIGTGFKTPRSLLFDSSGKMLILEQRTGIRRVGFTDHEGTCVEITENNVLLADTSLTHGIAFSNDGKTLFASSATQVFAWPYDAENGTLGEKKVVINNMNNSGHTTRTLFMSAKQPGTLLVSQGSGPNNDPEALDINSGISQIRAFDMSTLPNEPITYASGGKRIGWGLRNSVGVAEEPVKGNVYSVENSIDQIVRDSVDIHQNNPGEELNLHGPLSKTEEGGNHGYPRCFALWDTDVPNLGDMTTGSQFVMNSNGSDGVTDTQCKNDFIAPRITFPAHQAPLDVVFTRSGDAAYVSFHGSWNRDEPQGYRLSSIAFANGEPVAPSDSQTAAIDVLSNPSVLDCPDNCFRPCGLVFDSQGRLYMTSDSTGDIWILQKREVAGLGTPSGTKTASAGIMQETSTPAQPGTATRTGNASALGAVVAIGAILFASFMV